MPVIPAHLRAQPPEETHMHAVTPPTNSGSMWGRRLPPTDEPITQQAPESTRWWRSNLEYRR